MVSGRELKVPGTFSLQNLSPARKTRAFVSALYRSLNIVVSYFTRCPNPEQTHPARILSTSPYRTYRTYPAFLLIKAFLNGEVLITKLEFFEKKLKRQNSENRRSNAKGKSSKEKGFSDRNYGIYRTYADKEQAR